MTDGLINLLKPPGLTSHDAVNGVRRYVGHRRVGHGGTLDPLAAGVLPVFVGQATRLSRFTQEGRKAYRAEAVFGISTDTYDAAGTITQQAPEAAARLRRGHVAAALEDFRGTIPQRPPQFSAVRVDGERLHRRARRGERLTQAEVPMRTVTIYELELVDWQAGPQPRAWFHVDCSKGTYIRSLVQDLGRRLGCPAYLSFLVRTQAAACKLTDAVTPGELTARPPAEMVMRPLQAVAHLPFISVDEDEARAILNGQQPGPRPAGAFQPGAGGKAAMAAGRFASVLHQNRLLAVAVCRRPEEVRGPVYTSARDQYCAGASHGHDAGLLGLQLECVLP